jgi:hypothetical protein
MVDLDKLHHAAVLRNLNARAMACGMDRNWTFIKILRLYEANPKDLVALNLLEEMLKEIEEAKQTKPLLANSPNRFENVDGSVVIGQTENGTYFGLDNVDFFRHLLPVGATGTGKSGIMKLIASQLISRNNGLMVAIFAEKRNFRPLIRLLKDLVIIPSRFLRLVPFRNPKGFDQNDWLNICIPNFAEVDLRFPSLSYMREVVDEVCLKWGFKGDPEQPCPNFPEILDGFKRRKHHAFSDHARYNERGYSRIAGMHQTTGDIFRCHLGLNMERLYKRHFVAELDGLYPDAKKLIKSVFLDHNHAPKLRNKDYFDGKQHLFMIDEGQELFTRNSELHEILPFYHKFIAVAREAGSGLAVGSQIYRDLSLNVRSNASTKIATGFADRTDLDEFCRSVGISQNEQRAYLGRVLRPGTALVSTHKFPDPFLISVPNLGLDFEVSDEEVLERLLENVDDIYYKEEAGQVKEAIRRFLGRPANAVGVLSEPETRNIHDRSDKTTDSYSKVNSSEPDQNTEYAELREALKVLKLQFSRAHPYIPQTQLFREAGISGGSRQMKLKKLLQNHGLIDLVEVQRGRSRLIFIKPTEKGCRAIDVELSLAEPKPGFLHRLFEKYIELHALKNGYRVFRQWRLHNNCLVDLMLEKDEPRERIFIEIGASSAQNELNNAINDLSTEVMPDKLVMACKDKKMKNDLETLIGNEQRLIRHVSIIKVVLAGDFIQVEG